ncbi:putative KH domain-containing protein-like [Capsicum annuum]|nr:putative KH domain-containing protein-like [Capsicum annuum]
MHVAEMRMLKRMCGHTRSDRIRNEHNLGSVVDKIRKGRLRRLGHVKRRCHASVKRCERLDVLGTRRDRDRPKKYCSLCVCMLCTTFLLVVMFSSLSFAFPLLLCVASLEPGVFRKQPLYLQEKQSHKMSNPSDESGKEPNLGNDPPKGEVNDDLPAEDPKSSEEESREPSQEEQEELMKKKYGGLVKKKPPLITKDHERAFFDSADWALGKQGGQKAKTPAEALRPKLEPTPHQQLRTRLSASKLTDAGEDGSNNDLVQLDDQSGTPAADGENKS